MKYTKRAKQPMSCVSWASLKSRVQVIKHQGEAGEGREGRVGGLGCTTVASGLTTGRGHVGSQPQVRDGSC